MIDFSSSEIVRALAEAQKLRKSLASSSIVQAMTEAQKARELFASSGMAQALAEAQKLRKSLASSSIVQAMTEAQKTRELFAPSVLGRISAIVKDLHDVDFNINADGTISGKNIKFNINDIETAIESCLETAPASEKLSFEITINNFLNKIGKQHPVISKVLVFIFLPLLINIFSNMYFQKTKKFDQKIVVKQIKKEVQSVGVNDAFFRNYRFVSAETLNVRSNNSTKSRLVGKLYFGQMVRILQKKKNWTLIEYYGKDEDQIIIKGWTFTRYIKRFD